MSRVSWGMKRKFPTASCAGPHKSGFTWWHSWVHYLSQMTDNAMTTEGAHNYSNTGWQQSDLPWSSQDPAQWFTGLMDSNAPSGNFFFQSSPNLLSFDVAAGQDSGFCNFILIDLFNILGMTMGVYSTRLPHIILKREPISSYKHIVDFVRDIFLESMQHCITCKAIHKGDGPHEGQELYTFHFKL